MRIWSSKTSFEAYDYCHDFAPEIGAAEDLLDGTKTTVDVIEGDVTKSAINTHEQAVTVKIGGGTHQSLNKIRIRGETVGGRKVEVFIQLRVRDR